MKSDDPNCILICITSKISCKLYFQFDTTVCKLFSDLKFKIFNVKNINEISVKLTNSDKLRID